MSQRVRLEPQGPTAIEVNDVVPGQERWLSPIPRKRHVAVDDGSRDEDRRPKAVSLHQRQSFLSSVEIAVVEVEADRLRRDLAGIEKVDGRRYVDDAVPLGGQEVDLLAEPASRNGQWIVVVRNPVVEEDPQPAGGRLVTRSDAPPCRPRERDRRLDRTRQRGPNTTRVRQTPGHRRV